MHRLALTGLLPVLFAAVSGAQEPPVVTEAEFLSALEPFHPAVVDSTQELTLARARVVEAAVLDNPTVSALREDPEGPGAQTELVVSWQLPPGARRARLGVREEEAQAAAARHSQRMRELRLELRGVFADWALETARQERLAAQAERVESLAARELARSELGESSGLEAHRLQLAAAGLRSRLALARAAAARARAQAVRWMPALAADARPLLPELPPAPVLASEPPRIRAAAADLAAAHLAREAARRFLASPEVSVGWQRQETVAGSTGGPLVGLAWSVPLLDRNRSRQAAAEARLAGAGARLELARGEVAAAWTAALETFELLARSLRDSRSALAAGSRILGGAEAAFRLGEASLSDLLESHRAVTEGELASLDLYQAALAAHRELERLAGPDVFLASTTSQLQENLP